jgi:hypothetical protein
MGNIYNDEGTLDYAEAARTLGNLRAIGNTVAKSETVAQIQAAALVDIAVSLNAIVTGLATGGVWLDEPEREVGPDGEPVDPDERDTDEEGFDHDDDVLEVGDWVAPRGAGGTPLDGFVPGQIVAMGVSEGADWLDVQWPYPEQLMRVWAETVVRVDPPAASSIDEDEQPDPTDAVDELDDDFSPPTEVPAKPKKAKAKGKSKGGA